MEYDNKPLRFFLLLSRVVFAVVVVVNLCLPIFDGKFLNIKAFQVVVCTIWTYGMLCSQGFFKKPISKEHNGVVQYEISVPILQIGMTRVLEVLYYMFISHVSVNWRMFAVCVGIDVFYIVLILADKSNYYYESVEVEEK